MLKWFCQGVVHRCPLEDPLSNPYCIISTLERLVDVTPRLKWSIRLRYLHPTAHSHLLFSCTLGDESSEGCMSVMVVVMMVTAALGAGAAPMRNCLASYFSKRRRNGLKWVINTSNHKIGFLTHMAVIKDQQSALEIAWRPRYETINNKNLYLR